MTSLAGSLLPLSPVTSYMQGSTQPLLEKVNLYDAQQVVTSLSALFHLLLHQPRGVAAFSWAP